MSPKESGFRIFVLFFVWKAAKIAWSFVWIDQLHKLALKIIGRPPKSFKIQTISKENLFPNFRDNCSFVNNQTIF